MRLHSFSAYGFKSFAEKVDVVFDSGITAIVGPNGSGKSNISDAIRWVLGEQSIRSLRGNKMEDVIFAGSGKRRPLGVAEVALTFDNTDKTLPLDFAEVTVSRRLFRSGESEYTINKSACRLKDVYELFSDTGLGKGALAIIGQNKIDEILNSRPEERRALFEEAAGIARFKLRKREAEKKLEETAANLVRIQDIKAALEDQLEPMAESAERARRYFALEEDWRNCLVTLALGRIERFEAERQSLLTGLDGEKEQSTLVAAALSTKEADLEANVLEVSMADQSCQALQTDLHDKETAVNRLLMEQQVLTERTTQIGEASERMEREKSRVGEEQQTATRQQEEFAAERAAWKAGFQEKQEALQAAQAVRVQLAQHVRQLDEEEKLRRDTVFQEQHDAVTYRNETRTLERERQRLGAALDRIGREREDGELKLSLCNESLELATGEISTVQEKLEATRRQFKERTAERQSLVEKQQAALKHERQLQDQYAAVNARRTLLNNMQREYEGYARSIRVLLKANEPFRSELCGTVAELVEVPGDYLTAAEIALAGALQHVVTKTDDAAKKAIAFLKRQQAGRATFLPLSTIQPPVLRQQEREAANEPGILGRLSEFIRCEDAYRPVVEFLTGRTLLAESIDAALACAKKHQFRVRIVTLEGDLVNPGGSMSGGSQGKRDTGLLSRQAVLAEADKQLAGLDQSLASLRGEKSQQQRALIDAEQALETLRKTQEETQGVLIQAQARLDYLKTEQQRLQLQTEVAAGEESQRVDELQKLEQRAAEVKTLLAALEERQQSAAGKDRLFDQRRQALQAAQEEAVTALTNAEAACQTAKQRGAWIEERWRELVAATAKRTAEADKLQTEKDLLLRQLQETKTQQQALAQQEAGLQAEVAAAREKKDGAEQHKLSLLVKQKELEAAVRTERRRQTDVERRIHDLEMRLAKAEFQVNTAVEQLQTQTQLSVEEAQAVPKVEGSDAALEAQVTSLDTAMKELGPINPNAVQDYEQANERYVFLSSQQEDLQQAQLSLTEVISGMDKTMTEQFQEAFIAINRHFSTCFARLFGGGVASLSLADPKDALGSGVDITVQPPGKKMQHMALLSGGERALTVIALLFAVLLYKPSPFCVLDEIDAALDEANVDRFAQFLGELACGTQFIVITHRKGTMEAANVLHGVTMEESGVSRLLSVKMEDEQPKEALLDGIF